ncbi:MAG: ATP-binding cassette domain-containing protein [Proteobacteria bacterium]|nr:ATP-binding cassette domain-containing protein [Pseudomonadota bacterium]
MISVRNVSVAYPGTDQRAIADVSLDIAKGARVGLVGASGGGKTTLLNVVAGLVRPDGGSVLVDGLDISLALPDWHEQVGVVAQNAFMADASIRFNVAFGLPDEDIDDEQVWWALERAQLLEFVANLEEGLESSVGDRGVRLSGGQVQRLAIARALYKEPLVLLLDEPTASLDRSTEVRLVESLVDIGLDYTMLVVSHRPAILEHCNHLFRLVNGCMETVGSFEDLMAGSGEASDVTFWT